MKDDNYYVINTFYTHNFEAIKPIVERLASEGLAQRFRATWSPVSHCHFVKVYSECTGATCEEKYRLARSILARCSDAIGNIYEPLDKPRKEMVIPA